MGELSDLERAVLDMETREWASTAAKEDAVRDTLGLSMTSYYQVLGAAIDREAALACAPVLVNRLRRLRDERR